MNVVVMKGFECGVKQIGNMSGSTIVGGETYKHCQVLGMELIVRAEVFVIGCDSEFHFRLNMENDIGGTDRIIELIESHTKEERNQPAAVLEF